MSTSEDQFNGPTEIGYAVFPRLGISYRGNYEGRDVHVSFSEKRKKMRIFVDGVEWIPKPAEGGGA